MALIGINRTTVATFCPRCEKLIEADINIGPGFSVGTAADGSAEMHVHVECVPRPHVCATSPSAGDTAWAQLADALGDFIIATPLPVGDQQFAWKHQRDKLLSRLDALSDDGTGTREAGTSRGEGQAADTPQVGRTDSGSGAVLPPSPVSSSDGPSTDTEKGGKDERAGSTRPPADRGIAAGRASGSSPTRDGGAGSGHEGSGGVLRVPRATGRAEAGRVASATDSPEAHTNASGLSVGSGDDAESTLDEAVEMAWVIIANAYGGDWDKADPEWKEAAERWRDRHYIGSVRLATHDVSDDTLLFRVAEAIVRIVGPYGGLGIPTYAPYAAEEAIRLVRASDSASATLTYTEAHKALREGDIRHYLGWLYGQGYAVVACHSQGADS